MHVLINLMGKRNTYAHVEEIILLPQRLFAIATDEKKTVL